MWASARRGKWGQLTPPEKWTKNKKAKNMHKKSSFLRLCYILRAIRAGRCRERRYADHIFIQMYFRMHHSVVQFSKFLRLRRQGSIDPLTKILWTFLVGTVGNRSWLKALAVNLSQPSSWLWLYVGLIGSNNSCWLSQSSVKEISSHTVDLVIWVNPSSSSSSWVSVNLSSGTGSPG